MARRRSWRLFITRPLPLTIAVIGVASLCYGLWPSGRNETRAPRLMSEVDNQATGPALRPLREPVNSGNAPAARPSEKSPPADLTVSAETQVPSSPVSTQPSISRTTSEDAGDFEAGLAARARNDLLGARQQLSRAVFSGVLTPRKMDAARQALADLAGLTIFSPNVASGDPLVDYHQVASGQTLGKLAKQYGVSEDLLAEVNRIKDKHFIRQGMRLKIIRGPFHATVTKSEHMMHLFLGDVYVRSYRVALGAEGKTPTGKWRVTSRQANPSWVDPQTGKRYHADDPTNPIGEYWIGLEGIEGAAVGAFGYGIHGTNEPQTIGRDVSLGCIRLAPDDIAFVYKLLLPGASFVTTTD